MDDKKRQGQQESRQPRPGTSNASGISNRPLEEEKKRQDELPERGTSRDEGSD